MKTTMVDAIVAQSLKQIQIARNFKNGKIGNWEMNELMYYGRLMKMVESRSSVQLSRMQEFVHTLLSKIDNPLVFKFTKRKNSQTRRVELLNALREIDQKIDHWDIKDIVGKKQGLIYGRAVYSYYADSVNGRYKPHLTNVDVYDFLVDPMCGGLDLEEATYLGDYGIILDKKAIRKGMEDGLYFKKAAKELLEGSGNVGESTPEENNQKSRTYDQNTMTKRDAGDVPKDQYRFWRWYTTYEGERYYVLMTSGGTCLRCECLKDILPTSEDFPDGAWPYWTWAAFPDLTEFWTPSYCDYVREIFMAQDVTINQMLDNAEAINKPQKVVNTTMVEDLSQLKYRRDGVIKVKGDYDVNQAVQFVQTPSINAPIEVFNLLESIQEKSSGVTSQEKGVEDVEGKVGIYEGNQAAAADRFGLLSKSYSFGYERFARQWEMGVQANLVKKVAIELVGPNGVEVVEAKRSDLFKKGDSYGVMVEASNAELLASKQLREAKANFLTAQMNQQVPLINRKKAIEMQAEIAGFTPDQISELMDVSVYGNSAIMAEADRDIESLLLGEDIRPNYAANLAYKQRFVDFMVNHREDMSNEMFGRFEAYVNSLEANVLRNEARAMEAERAKQMMEASSLPPPRIGATQTPVPLTQ